MSDRVTMNLGDALELIIDRRGVTPTKLGSDWAASGRRVISAVHIKAGRVTNEDPRFVDQETYERWMPVELMAGDVLLTSEAPLGEVAYIPTAVQACLGQRLFGLRALSAVLDGRYLYYLLKSGPIQHQLQARASGTTVSGIRQAELVRVVVDLPNLGVQRTIGELLGAMDDRINSNRRLIQTCDSLIAAEVQAGLAVCRELRSLSDLASYVNGGAFTNGASGSGRMVIRIAELTKGPGQSTVYTDVDVPDERVARVGDILMAWSGSLGVHRWTRDEAIINQHIFKVLVKDFPPWLVFDRLKSAMPELRQIAADKATTMGHIKRHHLVDTRVPVPSRAVISRLDDTLGPLWERVVAAEREIHSVSALQGALLPELLSGRLRVPEAEELVSDVV